MKNYILTCQCDGMPEFALDAFGILFPGEMAEVYSGGKELVKLAEENAGTEFATYIRALARTKEKFAKLFVVDEELVVKKCINLRTGTEGAAI